MFAAATQVKAATLMIEKVGTTTVSTGATSWTYYGANPVIQGSASPSAVVSMTVGGIQEASATANTSGDWSITPTSLDSVGSYSLNFSSGTENALLTLNIASSSAGTNTTKGGSTSGELDLPETLPETGSEDILIFLVVGGIMLAAGVSSGFLLKD